ncbi:MAG: 4-hydroxy-tetrahydrodipicolinate reductase, partial [Bauldia sp.]
MSDMGLIVTGAAGRMGRTLIRVIAETPGVTLAGALERPGVAELGRDAGELAGLGPNGIKLSDDPLPVFAKAEGVLDFTS